MDDSVIVVVLAVQVIEHSTTFNYACAMRKHKHRLPSPSTPVS